MTHQVPRAVEQPKYTSKWEPVDTLCGIPASQSGGFSIDRKHVSCPECLAVSK